MALIKCEDCGREVSDKASVCIHCGCPISISQETQSIKVESKPLVEKEPTGWFGPLITILGMSGFLAIGYFASYQEQLPKLDLNPSKSEPKQQMSLSVGTCSGAYPTSKLQEKLRQGWKVINQSSYVQEYSHPFNNNHILSCNRTEYTLEK